MSKYFFLLFIFLLGLFFLPEVKMDFANQNSLPSLTHLFGTDWLGRDVMLRTFWGLKESFIVGGGAAFLSSILGLFLGILSAIFPKGIGKVITFIIDITLSMPHLVLLILLSFAFGGGRQGVILAIGFTHFPSLARIIRSETMQIREKTFIKLSRKLGKSLTYQIKNHYIPLLKSPFLVGALLLFPKSILHESCLTFLGFGLPPYKGTIGTMLSESISYLGLNYWWPSLLPGLVLIIFIKLFERIIYYAFNDNR